MNVGDYVIKVKGRQEGSTGLVVRIIDNDAKNTIVEVLVGDKTTLWPRQYVKCFEQEKQ